MQLTEWFSHDVKPALPGWYERKWGNASFSNDYFDGLHWYAGGPDDYHCEFPSGSKIKWRGLAEKP